MTCKEALKRVTQKYPQTCFEFEIKYLFNLHSVAAFSSLFGTEDSDKRTYSDIQRLKSKKVAICLWMESSEIFPSHSMVCEHTLDKVSSKSVVPFFEKNWNE